MLVKKTKNQAKIFVLEACATLTAYALVVVVTTGLCGCVCLIC